MRSIVQTHFYYIFIVQYVCFEFPISLILYFPVMHYHFIGLGSRAKFLEVDKQEAYTVRTHTTVQNFSFNILPYIVQCDNSANDNNSGDAMLLFRVSKDCPRAFFPPPSPPPRQMEHNDNRSNKRSPVKILQVTQFTVKEIIVNIFKSYFIT